MNLTCVKLIVKQHDYMFILGNCASFIRRLELDFVAISGFKLLSNFIDYLSS